MDGSRGEDAPLDIQHERGKNGNSNEQIHPILAGPSMGLVRRAINTPLVTRPPTSPPPRWGRVQVGVKLRRTVLRHHNFCGDRTAPEAHGCPELAVFPRSVVEYPWL